MACNCGTPNCTQTVNLSNCEGCQYTLNSDCVIFNNDRLSYEAASVSDGSARTLTSILKAIESINTKRESKIIEFSTDGVGTYTLVPEDCQKILLLTQWEDGVIGTISNTIILPQTLDFADQEIIIKDISTPLDPNTTTIEFDFNLAIQYEWAPAATSTALSDLWDTTHRTVRLRFVKTTPTSYQWIVVP